MSSDYLLPMSPITHVPQPATAGTVIHARRLQKAPVSPMELSRLSASSTV